MKEIGKTERTAIVENFLQECGTSLEQLKYKVATMSIDMTGTMQNKTVLFRALRRQIPSLDYYQSGSDGYNDHDRFWWEFPIYFYREMPSGEFIRYREEGYYLVDMRKRTITDKNKEIRYGEEEFLLVDENDKIIEKIEKKDLMNDLIEDLIEWNYDHFNDNWEEFITEYQKWINEVD